MGGGENMTVEAGFIIIAVAILVAAALLVVFKKNKIIIREDGYINYDTMPPGYILETRGGQYRFWYPNGEEVSLEYSKLIAMNIAWDDWKAKEYDKKPWTKVEFNTQAEQNSSQN
jgi:hypothetical protein